jgi:hypothetical protein
MPENVQMDGSEGRFAPALLSDINLLGVVLLARGVAARVAESAPLNLLLQPHLDQ